MRMNHESSSISRLLVFPLLTIAGFGFYWLRWHPEKVLGLAHCPMKDLTGIPCPTCGATHASAALASGNFSDALTANPLIVLVGGLFIIWAVWALLGTFVPVLRLEFELNSREKKATRILVALLLLLAWAWQLAMTFG